MYNKLSSIAQNISHDISLNGLGYNNLLHMATSLGDLQENPSDEEIRVLLIEEPEAHLHPQLLELLFDFFRKANIDSKIQIFMTSHSPSLVAKADLDDIHIITSSKFTASLVFCVITRKNFSEDFSKEILASYPQS